jgi:transposase
METHPVLPQELWDQTPPEVQAYIRVLEARVETMASIVYTLQEQVRTLQEQLNQTSQNSSRPPSSDPPQHRRPGHPQRHRRRGGQPGHPGHTRTLIPGEEVDEVVVLKPTQCTHCQAPLSGDDPKPWRHQVIEIPPIGYPLKAGQLTYHCRYSTIHGMPVTGGRGFRGLKPLWYNSVPP